MKKSFLLGLVALLLPLTTWAADNELTVTIKNANQSVEYNGANTKSALQIEVTNADGEVLTLNTDYQLLYNSVDKVGTGYTVQAIGISTYLGKNGSATFSVTPKVVTELTIKNGEISNQITKEYGTEDKDIDLSKFVTTSQLVAETEAEEADFIKCLKLVRKQGYENLEGVKDEISVTLVANDDEKVESNYEYNPGNGITYNVPLIITAKELTVERTDLVRKYNETQFGVSSQFALPYFKLEGIIGQDDVAIEKLTYSGGENLTDAGEYALTATLTGTKKDNYTVKEIDEDGNHVVFEIDKATLTVTKKSGVTGIEITYGDEDPDWFKNVYEFTPSYAISPATSPAAFAEAKAKTLVSITRAEGDNVKYDEDGKADGYNITIALTELGSKNYELAGYDEKKPDALVINPIKINEENGALVEDITYKKAENIEELLTYKGKDFADAENINLVKDLFTLTYGEDTELVYGIDYTISVDLGSNNTSQNGKAINAADKFNIQVTGIGNYSGGCWVNGTTPYEITRAALTIIAEDESKLVKVYDGEIVGDLTNGYGYKYEGLVGKDVDENGEIVEGEVLKMWCKGLNPGSYPVHVLDVNNSDYDLTKNGKTNLVNYVVTYDDWKTKEFTVLTADFVLDGSLEDETNEENIAAYAGLEVPNVKVKNLKSLMDAGFKAGDRWYTLVLPFDVTVREISNLFGYAIVNIPNTSNTDKDVTAMKLTMGTVPANTMMAFKVDNDLYSEDDINLEEGIEFKNKTIVAPTDEYSVENGNADYAGNKFIGVYRPTLIEEDYQFYLYPSNGLFYPASARTGGMLINALNGYVEFNPAADLSKVRFILEEADGSTTSISAVTGDVINSNVEGWYTVGGMKLDAQPTQKGVYINNGKKVVIK